MKNSFISLALAAALDNVPALAGDSELPECAVTAAESHGVELALYSALMRNELGDPARDVPCSFFERSALVLASSLEQQNGDRWSAVSLYINGRIIPSDPAVDRVRALYEAE
uniref:hypothetical protein n=1 Tax=Aquipseudomonas alcaligenes TaxID=43263 RepID=UPI00155DB7A7|nr:hypothetical protein [Pseudomonas alcaligenes]